MAHALDRGELSLPVLPRVAGEVIALCNDAAVDARELARLIERDAALAGNILRVANSPAYRGAVEVAALQQALSRLGLTSVRDIALSITLRELSQPLVTYSGMVERCWEASMGCALWSREIARLKRKNVEDAYLCGLLHNVGTTVILHWLVKQGVTLDDEAVASLTADHEEAAGALLARQWNLPAIVHASLVSASEGEAPQGEPIDAARVAFVKQTQALARVLMGFKQPDLDGLASEPEVVALNLYPDDLAELLQVEPKIREQVEAMSGL